VLPEPYLPRSVTLRAVAFWLPSRIPYPPYPFLPQPFQVTHAPPGTQAMTLDIAKFHHTCPIHPEHKPWFVMQTVDGFFIDHSCPFSCLSSSSNAGMITNTRCNIWVLKGVGPLLKYKDNLGVFHIPTSPPGLPYMYTYNCTCALDIISPLCIPWHPNKGQDFTETFLYIGFSWDISNKRASLLKAKQLKFLNRTTAFLSSFSNHPCQVLDVMKIHSSLCHIAFIYPKGCSHLPSLSNFIASFHSNTYSHCYPPHLSISDLKWWQSTLSILEVFQPIFPHSPPHQPLFLCQCVHWHYIW
jgi:hypothetical protein